MTGLDRVRQLLDGQPVSPPPVLPIIHTGFASIFGIPLGRYFTDPEAMAGAAISGYRRFGFDGVQLSSGVTAEAEALGAAVEQPEDAAPILREHPLGPAACVPGKECPSQYSLDALRSRDPAAGGRLPLFFRALKIVSDQIGGEAFILATLRGPFLIASQLRGVETILVDLLEQPDAVERLLDFAVEVAVRCAGAALAAGAHGLALGEAVCSPSFISPALYRALILPRHRRLVAELHRCGWRCVGLHVCGNTLPILEELISTGVDFLDIDYQVPAARASDVARNRVVLRGNLDPSAVLRFGTPDSVRAATESLRKSVAGARWILSSGCDIPPGTPAENLTALRT